MDWIKDYKLAATDTEGIRKVLSLYEKASEDYLCKSMSYTQDVIVRSQQHACSYPHLEIICGICSGAL